MAEPTLIREQHQTRYFVEQLPGDLGIDMIRVPGGTFLMGSPEDELVRLDTEGPLHEVNVPTFFMGRYPITQTQWAAVAELSQTNQPLKSNPSSFKSENHPVETVSWHDATQFCNLLSAYTKREYRLPSEAEWEYACRAETNTPFYFGETITTALANYRGIDDKERGWSGSYGQGPKGDYRQETTPVDYFGVANDFGLCDMHGNVWEWCQDHWHDSYEGAPSDEKAWFSEKDNPRRTVRGGSWDINPRNCRSASRNNFKSDYRYNHVGFRVVCNAPRALQ